MNELHSILLAAYERRQNLLDHQLTNAYRLCHGFSEGLVDICVDRYRTTLVILDYAEGGAARELIDSIANWYVSHAEGIQCVIWKQRRGDTQADKCGVIIFGEQPTTYIVENGVKYAVDLMMNLDASFYLDTRNVRLWLTANMADKSVLNMFAYTGSLGVAAKAAGAKHVVQTDLKKKFLEVGARSMQLNGFRHTKRDEEVGDFWAVTRNFRKHTRQFDCVILDPPHFSDTKKGSFDITSEYPRLFSKVQPLVKPGGFIISINNALFLDGETHRADLDAMCEDGHLERKMNIDVPADSLGDATVDWSKIYPKNPAPFNHSTKITVFQVNA